MTQKQNQSFSRRIGKSFSDSQKSILHECFNNIFKFAGMDSPECITLESISKNSELIEKVTSKLLQKENISLEIGLGMGEHLFSQMQSNPDKFFIGSEPYLNGVVSLKRKCDEANLSNYFLWPEDINILLNFLPKKEVFDQIYVLFPDPWPKRRQNRKRILNAERLNLFALFLKKGGSLNFATDIDSYSDQVLNLISASDKFSLIQKSEHIPHDGYTETKYHAKAISEGRVPKFFTFQKI